MLRRSFLEGLMGMLPIPFIKKQDGEVVFVDDMLGKYKNHKLYHGDVCYDYFALSNNRYIMWPVEAKLTIEFEYGERTYITFNINKEVFKKITLLTQKELKECFNLPKYEYDELYEKLLVEPVYIQEQKFLLSHISWYGQGVKL